LLATVLVSAPALANKHGDLGLGVVFGEPTGITGKMWLNGRSAVDAGLSYSFKSYFQVYADHLWHFPWTLKGRDTNVPLLPYVGIGAGVYFGNDVRATVRIPLGIEWQTSELPLGVFLEFVPGLRFAPDMDADFGGGIGVRYYF
jgi:hypothetical protein